MLGFLSRLHEVTGLCDPTADQLLDLARTRGCSVVGLVADALLGS